MVPPSSSGRQENLKTVDLHRDWEASLGEGKVKFVAPAHPVLRVGIQPDGSRWLSLADCKTKPPALAGSDFSEEFLRTDGVISSMQIRSST